MYIILTSLNNNFPLISILLCIIIIMFSIKGNLSPLITITLIVLIGFVGYLSNNNYINSTEDLSDNIVTLKTEIAPQETLPKQNIPSSDFSNKKKKSKNEKKSKPQSKKEIKQKKTDKKPIEELSINDQIIPAEYDVTDSKLLTYKIESTLELDKSFIEYFEKATRLRMIKKGNYEIKINYDNGNFSQREGINERETFYSGGEIQLKVNGEMCCCDGIISVPQFSSIGNLKKAKAKLKEQVNQLFIEYRIEITKRIQQCL